MKEGSAKQHSKSRLMKEFQARGGGMTRRVEVKAEEKMAPRL